MPSCVYWPSTKTWLRVVELEWPDPARSQHWGAARLARRDPRHSRLRLQAWTWTTLLSATQHPTLSTSLYPATLPKLRGFDLHPSNQDGLGHTTISLRISQPWPEESAEYSIHVCKEISPSWVIGSRRILDHPHGIHWGMLPFYGVPPSSFLVRLDEVLPARATVQTKEKCDRRRTSQESGASCAPMLMPASVSTRCSRGRVCIF